MSAPLRKRRAGAAAAEDGDANVVAADKFVALLTAVLDEVRALRAEVRALAGAPPAVADTRTEERLALMEDGLARHGELLMSTLAFLPKKERVAITGPVVVKDRGNPLKLARAWLASTPKPTGENAGSRAAQKRYNAVERVSALTPVLAKRLEDAGATFRVCVWVAYGADAEQRQLRCDMLLHLRRVLMTKGDRRGGWLDTPYATAALGVLTRARAAAKAHGAPLPAPATIPLEDYKKAMEKPRRRGPNRRAVPVAPLPPRRTLAGAQQARRASERAQKAKRPA